MTLILIDAFSDFKKQETFYKSVIYQFDELLSVGTAEGENPTSPLLVIEIGFC